MTKSMQNKFKQWYRDYVKSDTQYLWQAYGNYSRAKENAYNEIVERYNNNFTHHSIWIISHNSSHFVTAAVCEIKQQYYFIVETYRNTYTCGYNHGDLIDLETGEVFSNE